MPPILPRLRKIVKSNDRILLNEIFGTKHEDDSTLHKYMKANKTSCALAIFESDKKIKCPDYILRAIGFKSAHFSGDHGE